MSGPDLLEGKKHAYPIDTGWCWGMILRISDYPRILLGFSISCRSSPSGAYPATLRVFECSSCAQLGDPLVLRNQTYLC